MTSITISTRYNTVSLSTPDDDLTIMEVMEQLVIPASIAIGYHPESVCECFDEEKIERFYLTKKCKCDII